MELEVHKFKYLLRFWWVRQSLGRIAVIYFKLSYIYFKLSYKYKQKHDESETFKKTAGVSDKIEMVDRSFILKQLVMKNSPNKAKNCDSSQKL